jgi:hypothetical protein
MMSEHTALTKKNDASIPEGIRAVLKQILVLYYTGQVTSIQDAVAQVGDLGRTTFYKYKGECPAEFEAIVREAKAEAFKAKDDKQIAFDAEQFDVSVRLQREAFAYLLDALPGIASIAKGEVREVKAGGKKKVIVPYPRDQNEAVKILQQLARGGVLPDSSQVTRLLDQPGDKKSETRLPALPVSAQFTSVVARTADGTTVTVERGSGVDIIEGEVIDDGE